jgi:hypothetical protein
MPAPKPPRRGRRIAARLMTAAEAAEAAEEDAEGYGQEITYVALQERARTSLPLGAGPEPPADKRISSAGSTALRAGGYPAARGRQSYVEPGYSVDYVEGDTEDRSIVITPTVDPERANGQVTVEDAIHIDLSSVAQAPANSTISANALAVIRRLLAGDAIDQAGSGLSPPEWRDLMLMLGREFTPVIASAAGTAAGTREATAVGSSQSTPPHGGTSQKPEPRRKTPRASLGRSVSSRRAKAQSQKLSAKTRAEIIGYTRIIVTALDEVLDYERVKRRNAPPPILWIDDREYIKDVNALISEINRLNKLLEEGKRVPKKHQINLVHHANRFLDTYVKYLAAGSAALTVGAFATVLSHLGLDPTHVITKALRH